jgi:hypothetical protein
VKLRSLWNGFAKRIRLHLKGPALERRAKAAEAEAKRRRSEIAGLTRKNVSLRKEMARRGEEVGRLSAETQKLGAHIKHLNRKIEALRREYAERSRSRKELATALKQSERARAAAAQAQSAAEASSLEATTSLARERYAGEELRLLLRAAARETSFPYGSYTPGVAAWDEKWDRAPAGRVLFFAPKDYSGSLFRWADALNRHSGYAARVVVLRGHPFGYQNDLVLPHPSVAKSDLAGLAAEADIIHLKDEEGWFEGKTPEVYEVLERAGKPVVFTHYGGYARKYKNSAEYRSFVAALAARVAMTPDLCYPWFAGEFIPHTIDAELFPAAWRDGNVIAHSPSTETRKGTADLIAAIDGLGLELDLIKDVPHDECLRRKRHCSLFFDQAGRERAKKMGVDDVIGWYGNSALEAAVLGIPTIAHLSDEAFAQAEGAGCAIRETCAILNTPLGAEGIRETIRGYLALSPEDRTEVSRRTRRWIEDFHSFPVVGGRLASLYGRLR